MCSSFIELLSFRVTAKLLSVLCTGESVKEKGVQIIFHPRPKDLSRSELLKEQLQD